MSERSRAASMQGVSRRSFLYGAAALLSGTAGLTPSQTLPAQVSDTSALKRAARQSGKTLGMFTVQHELLFDPVASAIRYQPKPAFSATLKALMSPARG